MDKNMGRTNDKNAEHLAARNGNRPHAIEAEMKMNALYAAPALYVALLLYTAPQLARSVHPFILHCTLVECGRLLSQNF